MFAFSGGGAGEVLEQTVVLHSGSNTVFYMSSY